MSSSATNNPFFPSSDYKQTSCHTGDAVTTDFVFTMTYVGQSSFSGTQSDRIKVYLDGTLQGASAWTMPNNTTVRFTTAPSVGQAIVIRTDHHTSDRLVTYSASNVDDLNTDSLQAWYLLREDYDRLLDTQQIVTTRTMPAAFAFTGNGSETTFVLDNGTASVSDLTQEHEVFCYFDGVKQAATTYTLTDDSNNDTNVIFDTAPANGVSIEIIPLVAGTPINTELEDASVTGSKIASEAIDDLALIDPDIATLDNSVIVFDLDSGGAMGVSARQLVHTDITDFDAGVRANRLDQMGTPTSSLSMGSEKITNLTDGTTATQDACSVAQMEAYVSANASGGKIKTGATVVSTSSQQISVGFDYDAIHVWVDYLPGVQQSGFNYTNYKLFIASTIDGVTKQLQFRKQDGVRPWSLDVEKDTSTTVRFQSPFLSYTVNWIAVKES